jgi:hypothetical protein
MDNRIDDEIKRATEVVGTIEKLVVAKGRYPTGDRNDPLVGYWSLAFEFHRAILCLIVSRFNGAASALLRPMIETAIRAHLVIFVPDDVLKKILNDEYRTNFGTVGKEIDDFFGIDGYFEAFLNDTRDALHGYTHVGMHQLGRRFTGADVMPNYSDDEIIEYVHTSTRAIFMVNNIVTKHLGFEAEWEENTKLFDEWSNRRK